MGTTALVAEAVGNRDEQSGARIFFQAIVIGGAVGAGLVVAQGVIAWGGFRLFGASSEVTVLAKQYFSIRTSLRRPSSSWRWRRWGICAGEAMRRRRCS